MAKGWTAAVGERWQRRILWALVLVPVVILGLFVPLASSLTSGWSNRLIALGLAFEIAGAWAIFARPLVEESGFWLIRMEADEKTRPGFYAAAFLLPVGFSLQFISVVFL